jgi:hypothetical protein
MLKQFFILCSGADTDILNDCSLVNKETSTRWYWRNGIFFTAVMAAIAGSYALFRLTIYILQYFGYLGFINFLFRPLYYQH